MFFVTCALPVFVSGGFLLVASGLQEESCIEAGITLWITLWVPVDGGVDMVWMNFPHDP